jgi:hypothetical protein
MPARDPPIGGLIDESPEHSVRMGVRGGPGRIRTSSQTVMRRSAQTIELRARCARLEKLPLVVM